MANFCLTEESVNKFLRGLKSGDINPEKLSSMSSEERRSYLEQFVGKENALDVNALFESKLLLKDQQQGMITWAKQVSGIKIAAKRDLISRIKRMENVLNPENEDQFLSDLAEKKLGVPVTQQEAKNIVDLSKKIDEAKGKMNPDSTFNTEDERMSYGRAKVAFGNYVNGLKEDAEKTSILTYAKNPQKALSNSVSATAGLAKAIKASLDDSALFRQGWKTLWTHPGIWQKNARKSFVDIVRTFGKKPVMDEVTADIISRPNYDRMVRARLATATIEEAFPTDLPSKIPLFGRFYKASETAYTAFLHRQRADIFDKYLDIAKKSGLNIDDVKVIKPIASMVNSLTGRGNLGGLEPAANAINNVFFSPRLLKSQIDTLGHVVTGAGGSNFVRKHAAINLLKIIMGTAAVLTIARAVNKDSVELDPRSSDFGKIKIGSTRFDVTGGMSSVITLAARVATMSSKSSTTGRVTPLNSGKFGSQTGVDVINNFFENKLSPAFSVLKDIAKGQDFNGNPLTIGGELNNLFTPLPITTYQELKNDPNSANKLLSLIADGLGISVNTYGQQKTNWEKSTSKELLQFKSKVGDKSFKQANDKYNKAYDAWFNKISKTGSYKNLSDEGKQSLITKSKAVIQDRILRSYNFKYRKPILPSSKRRESSLIKSLTPR